MIILVLIVLAFFLWVGISSKKEKPARVVHPVKVPEPVTTPQPQESDVICVQTAENEAIFTKANEIDPYLIRALTAILLKGTASVGTLREALFPDTEGVGMYLAGLDVIGPDYVSTGNDPSSYHVERYNKEGRHIERLLELLAMGGLFEQERNKHTNAPIPPYFASPLAFSYVDDRLLAEIIEQIERAVNKQNADKLQKDKAEYRRVISQHGETIRRYITRYCELSAKEAAKKDKWGDVNKNALLELKNECMRRIIKLALPSLIAPDYWADTQLGKLKYSNEDETVPLWIRRMYNHDLPNALKAYRPGKAV